MPTDPIERRRRGSGSGRGKGKAAPNESGSPDNGARAEAAGTDSTVPGNGSRVVAKYDYLSRDGRRRAQKVRKEPKQFYWRVWTASNNWQRSRNMPFEVRLYRQKELLQAIKDGKTIYVVDGEKDVDTLAAHGFVATCGPHGSERWRDEDAALFKGARRIVVIQDDDSGRSKPEHRWHGYDGAVRTKNSIGRVIDGDRVSIRACAKGCKDISEHFGAGHGIGDLEPSRFPSTPRPVGHTRYAAVPGPEDDPILHEDRPGIDITDMELHELAEEASGAVVLANHPPDVFLRGDMLARIVDGEDGVYADAYNADTLREHLSKVAHWTKTLKDGEQRLVRPDRDVIGFLLSKKEYPDLPQLDRIVTAPVLAPDGSILTSPGYNASTRTFFYSDGGVSDLKLPRVVTPERASRALNFITTELLADFPFASKSDRAHALALFLLPFLRELIPGPTPLHLLDAPTAGTGKGLLAEVALYPGIGRIAVIPEPGTSDEYRKAISSHLAKAPSAITFDNVTGVLGGGPLEAALTALVWEDRILGVSRTMRAKVRNLWVATSNNAKLTSDMPRRTLLIRLNANKERPAERPVDSFRHPNLRAWAEANRRRLVLAALYLCRAWVREGMPAAKLSASMGSYEDWARVVGGVLEVAGVPGFLANRGELYESAATEAGEMAVFLRAWHERFGNSPVLAKQVAQEVASSGKFAEVAPTSLTPHLYKDTLTLHVGYLLRRHRDGVFGRRQLRSEKKEGYPAQWRVIKL